MTPNCKKKIRNKLMFDNPHCYFCGCRVFAINTKNGKQLDNSAVLSKKDSMMRLSCYKCERQNSEIYQIKNNPEFKVKWYLTPKNKWTFCGVIARIKAKF